MTETTRTVLASHSVPGMINVDVVITRVQTGAATTHQIQACSPARMGGRVFCETFDEARDAANRVWTALRNGARDHGRTTLAHDASTPVPGTETVPVRPSQPRSARRSIGARAVPPRPAAPRVTYPYGWQDAPRDSQVAAGDYAVEYGGSLRFFTVSHGRTGTRWEGYTFVNEGSVAIRDRAARESILAAIIGQQSATDEVVADENRDGEPTCCDGTGWTGVDGQPCAEHYEPVGWPWVN